jgi:hypothetical protein
MNQHGLAGALLQWWSKRQSKKNISVRKLHILETLPLNSKQKLMLVCCAGQQFLVGAGVDEISSIIRVESVEESIGGEVRCDS